MYQYATENDAWFYFRLMRTLARGLTPRRLLEMDKYAKKILSIIKKEKPDENGVRVLHSGHSNITLYPNGMLTFPYMSVAASYYVYFEDENRPLLSQDDIDNMAVLASKPDFTEEAARVAKTNAKKNKPVDRTKYTSARLKWALDDIMMRPCLKRDIKDVETDEIISQEEWFPSITVLLLAKHLKLNMFKSFGEPLMFSNECSPRYVNALTRDMRKANNKKSFVEMFKMIECQEKMPTPLLQIRNNRMTKDEAKNYLSQQEYNAYMLNMLINYINATLLLFAPKMEAGSDRTVLRIPTVDSINRLRNIISNLDLRNDINWQTPSAVQSIKDIICEAKMDFSEIDVACKYPRLRYYINQYICSGSDACVCDGIKQMKDTVCLLYDTIYELTDNNPIMRELAVELGLIEIGYHPTFYVDGLYLFERPDVIKDKQFASELRSALQYGKYSMDTLEGRVEQNVIDEVNNVRVKLFGTSEASDVVGFVDVSFEDRFNELCDICIKQHMISNPIDIYQCAPAIRRALNQMFDEELGEQTA